MKHQAFKPLAKHHLWLVFLAFFLCQCPIFAQELQKAKIKLINGTKVEGFIVESMNESYIKIHLVDDSPLIINYNKIKTIRFEQGNHHRPGDKQIVTNSYTPGINKKALFHEITGNLMFGQDYVDISLHTVNGYQCNQYLGAGVGLGIEHYDNYTTLPLYAEAKGYLFDRKVTPFYFGDAGYAFAWNNSNPEYNYQNFDMKGGLFWQVGVGYQFNFAVGAMVVKLGYKNQSIHSHYSYLNPWYSSDMLNNDNVDIKEDRTLRRFVLGLGFLF